MSTDDKKLKMLRTKISQFKGQITRAAKFAAEQEGQVLVDLEGVKIRMEDLQKGLHAYKMTILEVQLLSENDEEADGEQFSEDDVEDKCYAVMSSLRHIVRDAERVADTPPTSPRGGATQAAGSTQGSRLPPLDIAYFNGKDITQYTPFIEIFEAIVDKDATLSPVQKLYYLRKYLQDRIMPSGIKPRCLF
ncbi:uncharacterized protein [Choristoneura fumiferana]|uniref:uncharacterized protein n=1 Tax=Choristoneura fumiferana TaxID=7141 RepID=UPI003D1567A9